MVSREVSYERRRTRSVHIHECVVPISSEKPRLPFLHRKPIQPESRAIGKPGGSVSRYELEINGRLVREAYRIAIFDVGRAETFYRDPRLFFHSRESRRILSSSCLTLCSASFHSPPVSFPWYCHNRFEIRYSRRSARRPRTSGASDKTSCMVARYI